MKREIIPIFLSGIGILGFIADKLIRVHSGNYEKFSGSFSTTALGVSILIFLVLRWVSHNLHNGTVLNPLKNWLTGFLLTTIASLLFISVINPYGRFPWNRGYDFYIISGAREIKIEKFRSLTANPELVVFGSSHAFSVSPAYIKDKFDTTAFNFSVAGSGALDYLIFTRLIIESDGEAPLVAVIEFPDPDLDTARLSDAIPLDMWKYLSLPDQISLFSGLITQGTKMNGVSDAIFSLAYVRPAKDWKPLIHYLPDGGGILAPAALTQKYYEKNTKVQAPDVFKLYQCESLSLTGREYTDELVRLSQEYHFSIVFYRNPLNKLFFDTMQTQDPKYRQCQKMVDKYFEGLVKKYPNIYFRDLTYYPPISDLGITGYIDIQHPNAFGAERLIDALEPEIKSGLMWAGERKNISK